MPTRYTTDPFKVFYVKDPQDGARRRLKNQKEARALAAELARSRGAKLADVLLESRTYFVFEYAFGAKRGRRVNTGEKTLFLAKEWARKRMSDRRGPVRTTRKDFAAAVDEWIAELEVKGRSPATLREYRYLARYWKEYFTGKGVAEIAHDEILSFFKKRSKIEPKKRKDDGTEKKGTQEPKQKERDASPRLLNINLTLLKAFFDWSKRLGYAEANPTEDLKPWKQPHKEPRILEPAEIQALLKACKEPYGLTVKREEHRPYESKQGFIPPPHLYPVTICGLTTILRLGNVLDLRWGEVDFERDEIRIAPEKIKTRTEMVIPLGATLKACLAGLPKGGPEAPVFGGAREIQRSFSSAVKRAKIRGASFHALRRTGATYLCRAGVPVEVVRKLGGWSTGGDVLFTHYRKVDMEELREAVKKLDALVTGPPAARKATQSVEGRGRGEYKKIV